jgi:hypothetical protein
MRPNGLCQYILSDSRPYVWCDEVALPGKLWCETHHRRCTITVHALHRAKILHEETIAQSLPEAA